MKTPTGPSTTHGHSNLVKQDAAASSSTNKVKTAAVAAAAAVSINLASPTEQLQKPDDLKSISSGQSSFNNETGKKNLIRQISVSIHNNNPTRKSSSSIDKIISSKRDSLASNSTLVGSNMHHTLNARIIGDENWAPVRDQLILNQTPKTKRLDQMVYFSFQFNLIKSRILTQTCA